MSHFIANTITFSKDLSQFKVKGGDNNVVPRSNNWSDWIDTTDLLYLLKGGSLQFNTLSSEKKALVQFMVNQLNYDGGGYYADYNRHRDGELKGKALDYFEGTNRTFLMTLKEGLKTINNKKNFVVEKNGSYLDSIGKAKSYYLTSAIKYANKYSKYVAIAMSKRFDGCQVVETNINNDYLNVIY